jgi:hypothetical protein
MQEDLCESGSEFPARNPPKRARSLPSDMGFMTYLVRGRFDLGRRQQDLELVDAKVANADAPATARTC